MKREFTFEVEIDDEKGVEDWRAMMTRIAKHAQKIRDEVRRAHISVVGVDPMMQEQQG